MKYYVLFAGETLQDERVNGGAFIGTDGLQFPHKLIPVSSHVFLHNIFWCPLRLDLILKILQHLRFHSEYLRLAAHFVQHVFCL